MGQEIFYCFKCHSRLVSSDFEKAGAFRLNAGPCCKACLPGLFATLTPAERDSLLVRPKATGPAPDKTPRPEPLPSSPARAKALVAPPARGSGKTVAWAAAAAGLSLGALLTVFLTQKPVARPNPVASAPTPVPVVTPPVDAPKPAPAVPAPVAIPVRSPTPGVRKPVEPTPEEMERERKAAEFSRLREEIKRSVSKEAWKPAMDRLTAARGSFPAEDLTSLEAGVREGLDQAFAEQRERALEARRTGREEELRVVRSKVESWGFPDLSTELAKAIEAVPPPPTKEARDYAIAWEAAMRQAAGREFPAALAALDRASKGLTEAALKAEAAADLELVRSAGAICQEALAALAKLAADQPVDVEVYDEAGTKATAVGVLIRQEPGRLVLKKQGIAVGVELGEVTAAYLGSSPRGKKEPRGASALACIEGDVQGAERPGATIPAKYRSHAERLRTDPGEATARSLFHSAGREFSDFSTRSEAVAKYKSLLADRGGTAFVRRNQASIAARGESGKEYVFFPSSLVGGGTFRIQPDAKLGAIWTSGADSEKEKVAENFVQLSFSVLPGTPYRCWVYVGACCGETFTFACQATDLTANQPGDPGVVPVKHAISVSARLHSAHGGPKQPVRWAWVSLPLPKYSSPGPKKVRLLSAHQGFSVAFAVVSAGRASPPTEAELRKMERPLAEAPLNLGLVAHWKFDEGSGRKAADSSGRENHGLFVRGVEWTAGKIGGAIRVDRDNYVQVAHAPSLSFAAADSFTVSLWVDAGDPGGGWRAVFAKSRDVEPHWGVWLGEGHWVFASAKDEVKGPAWSAGWHHVAAVQDGATRERHLYVDGKKAGSCPAAEANGAGELRIGAAKGVSEYLTGTIDDVRVYARALTSAEIAQLSRAP